MPPWATLVGIGFGVFLFGIGLGLVIADQRGPEQPARPELHVKLFGADVFVPTGWPDKTGIGLQAMVWNTGAHSIVTGWGLKVIPNGKEPVIAQITEMPNRLTATGESRSADLRSSDSLENKSSTSPVGLEPVKGILLFYVALPKQVVNSSDTVWEVTAKDIYEKETRVTQMVGNWLGR